MGGSWKADAVAVLLELSSWDHVSPKYVSWDIISKAYDNLVKKRGARGISYLPTAYCHWMFKEKHTPFPDSFSVVYEMAEKWITEKQGLPLLGKKLPKEQQLRGAWKNGPPAP